MKRNLLFLLLFTIILMSCSAPVKQVEKVAIIPKPLEQTIGEGRFILNYSTDFRFDDSFKSVAHYFQEFLKTSVGYQLDFKNQTHRIELLKDESIQNVEGYELEVSKTSVIIKARHEKGAFYGVQTLLQLIPTSLDKDDVIGIPVVSIKDEPQFVYRGMHIDVGRHFYSVSFIKKYIDLLSRFKLNTFHWHLTEDQGWRIEIKKYPKLQEIGAYRKETLIGHNSDQPHQFDGKRYGGFYTQEQIKEVVAYATKRQVTVIPEIEMPGHSQAALAAYPELGCTGKSIETATKWGVFEDIYCPKENTFKFLEDVIDEVVDLFPGKYIHIGGDEAPKARWKNCKHCQQLIKKENLKDEHGLQSYFIARMEKYINSKGKQIIGWDEILEGGLAPNATVMSWRGINGAVEAAKDHHDVILTPTSHLYFDYYQSTQENEPLAIGGFLPLEKVYNFNPIPEELKGDYSKYVLGAQGNVWTEYMTNSKQVEYMTFPRMIALSEVVWSAQNQKDFTDFKSRLEQNLPRLDALDVHYANHLYEISSTSKVENGYTFIQLASASKDKEIRFTVNGSDPTNNSQLYTEPIKVTEDITIKAAAFKGEKQLSNIFQKTVKNHLAIGKNVTLNIAPNDRYKAQGVQSLVNGINGSNKRFNDTEWLGFDGKDLEITIDFEKPTDISAISTRFNNSTGSWIYAPKEIGFSFKTIDGKTINNLDKIDDRDDSIINYNFTFEPITTTSLTITIPNYGIIPKGKNGAGHKPWTFIDELIIE